MPVCSLGSIWPDWKLICFHVSSDRLGRKGEIVGDTNWQTFGRVMFQIWDVIIPSSFRQRGDLVSNEARDLSLYQQS